MSSHGYHFVFEYPEGTDYHLDGKLVGGKEDQVDITITLGKQMLRVLQEKMILNSSDRGAVKKGDSIKLSSTGKVWVNGQLRGE